MLLYPEGMIKLNDSAALIGGLIDGQRDVDRLLSQLNHLVDAGHTVVVVEHEMRVVAQSDWVIDIGPGAGDLGGKVVVSGTPQKVATSKKSRTAPFLAKELI